MTHAANKMQDKILANPFFVQIYDFATFDKSRNDECRMEILKFADI